MAIEFNCPHCATPYRLKDELAGKKATCRNPDCRQVITIPAPRATVPPTASPPAAPPAKAKMGLPADAKPPRRDQTPAPRPPKPEEVEAAALAALADAPKEEQAPDAPIPMVCAFCDHKWNESRDKAGKNVLCPNPECRQRNKVPVPKDEKPKDWRAEDTGPSLRKELFDKPTDVVTSGDAKYVSGKSLVEADAIEDYYEPVPLKRRLVFALVILAPVVALGYGVYRLTTTITDRSDDKLVADALKDFKVPETMPAGEGALFSALLYTAAGQYAITETQGEKPDEALKKALEHFSHARDDLRHAGQKDDPKKGGGAARFAVGGELALAQLGLGGGDEAVTAGTRYRWVPSTSNRKLKVNEKVTDVHTELGRTLQLVLPADFDYRIALARRLTRELVKKGQADVAADLPVMLFAGPEQPEAKAVVALEVWRADKAHPLPKHTADELKAALAKNVPGGPAFPASAVVLWKAVGTEKAPTNLGDGKLHGNAAASVQPNNRAIAVGLALLDGKADEAAEAVRRPGELWSRMKAAVQIGEWTGDPGAALDVVLSQVAGAAAKKGADPAAAPPASLLLRLSQLAAAAGKADAARQLADAIPDEGLRAWARADAIRLGTAEKSPVDETGFEVPSDPAKLRAGHGWVRFWAARHNARLSGDKSKERKAIRDWPDGTVQPLGLAGIALGVRER